MFAFLLLFAFSATEKQEEQNKDRAILSKEKVVPNKDDDDVDDEKVPVEKQLADAISSINTTELFDSLDEKVDELLDGIKSEAKVFQKKALKEVKRGAKRLEKKLKHLFHKKHHK